MSKPRALLSVTDKTSIVQFGRRLIGLGFELISTGGTAKALRADGLAVLDVSEVTGSPEMLDGRVKTLHPKIHGGLLGITSNPDHVEQMLTNDISPISVLAVNLYAFEKIVTSPHTHAEMIESIDIGGPAMIRAGAKNHASVAVVVDPADYDVLIDSLENGGVQALRVELAAKAFAHTAYYDSVIARALIRVTDDGDFADKLLTQSTLTLGLKKVQDFRYGENPHQKAAMYQDALGQVGLPQSEQLWGKELSYNNIADSHGAWELVGDLLSGSCAIIKHGNPCGVARGGSLAESYAMARSSDPISAFGGIAAFNSLVDQDAAMAMTEKGNFLEVVIAPDFTGEALEIFQNRSGWGKDVRLLQATLPVKSSYLSLKTIRGGAVIQNSDEDLGNEWRVVTNKMPTEAQMRAMKLQWAIVQHVKSNAIVIGNEHQLFGVGAGQMNRVQSVRLAIDQAGANSVGASLASDAFFPFPDSVETAAAAQIACLVTPGGSKKDPEVIAKADELGLVMCFTGVRHFNH